MHAPSNVRGIGYTTTRIESERIILNDIISEQRDYYVVLTQNSIVNGNQHVRNQNWRKTAA